VRIYLFGLTYTASCSNGLLQLYISYDHVDTADQTAHISFFPLFLWKLIK